MHFEECLIGSGRKFLLGVFPKNPNFNVPSSCKQCIGKYAFSYFVMVKKKTTSVLSFCINGKHEKEPESFVICLKSLCILEKWILFFLANELIFYIRLISCLPRLFYVREEFTLHAYCLNCILIRIFKSLNDSPYLSSHSHSYNNVTFLMFNETARIQPLLQ